MLKVILSSGGSIDARGADVPCAAACRVRQRDDVVTRACASNTIDVVQDPAVEVLVEGSALE